MIKRVLLFVITNLLVIVLLSIILFILQSVFGVRFDGYMGLLIFAAIVGFGGAFISLFISKWIAKKFQGVKLIDSKNLNSFPPKAEVVYKTVDRISKEKNIKMPEVGVYESSEPNAFATGYSKNNSLVAVSTGLLNSMNEDEIEGVIAHEMSHVLSGDMVTMTLLQGVVNTFVVFLSRIALMAIKNATDNEEMGFFAEITILIILETILMALATPVIMAFSRYREYRADDGSANLAGKGKMIAALNRLKSYSGKENHSHDSMAAFKISSNDGWTKWFASHPSLDDRIKALETK